jgi:hypothetical protein
VKWTLARLSLLCGGAFQKEEFYNSSNKALYERVDREADGLLMRKN